MKDSGEVLHCVRSNYRSMAIHLRATESVVEGTWLSKPEYRSGHVHRYLPLESDARMQGQQRESSVVTYS
jgi:hypothetical protein